MKKRTHLSRLAVALLIAGPLSLTACGKSDAPKVAAPDVVVSKPITQPVTPYLAESGNTVASLSVDLVARVSGVLESVHFTDGSPVKQGDLLFVIQPEPYQNQVAMAKATLDESVATYQYDQTEYERQLKMYKRQATSLTEVQQWKSTRDSAAANVESAKANLANEKLNYSYTHVTAPINGRIGRHLVDPGNLVGDGSATALATIDQVAPIYVYFNINELDLIKLRKLAHKKGFKPGDIHQVPVEASLQDEDVYQFKGYLDFAATTLDAATGTIQMRAVLPNTDWVLLPGQFVKLRLALGQAADELTVPDTAVLYDQIGAYVYTVDNHHKVEQMRVTVGQSEQGRIPVLDGISARDHVIVSGLQNASPGITVNPTEKTSA